MLNQQNLWLSYSARCRGVMDNRCLQLDHSKPSMPHFAGDSSRSFCIKILQSLIKPRSHGLSLQESTFAYGFERSIQCQPTFRMSVNLFEYLQRHQKRYQLQLALTFPAFALAGNASRAMSIDEKKNGCPERTPHSSPWLQKNLGH